MNCRHCALPLKHLFLDLGSAPPSNAYLSEVSLQKKELSFPLRLFVCDRCWLVQTEDYLCSQELFTADYAYFSSTSAGWTQHAADYCTMIVDRLALNQDSFVIEIAANDGYLLKNFLTLNVPCLGIEPTESTARAAEKQGIEVVRKFFDHKYAQELVEEGRQADLIIGNNVYAHVPDINDFTSGLKKALKPKGTITLEFPHLLNLIRLNQFDTVYHEHYSYLSLHTVQSLFADAGLIVYDLEKLPTHGGSLRVYGGHADEGLSVSACVIEVLNDEKEAGMLSLSLYLAFQSQADRVKADLLDFLLTQKAEGKQVAAYGAAAKGNTLLNYAGVKADLLSFVSDAAPSKQGKYMPGSHIPILPPEAIREHKPDYVLILPWNIKEEIMQRNECVKEWGGRFVTAIPELKVH